MGASLRDWRGDEDGELDTEAIGPWQSNLTTTHVNAPSVADMKEDGKLVHAEVEESHSV